MELYASKNESVDKKKEIPIWKIKPSVSMHSVILFVFKKKEKLCI